MRINRLVIWIRSKSKYYTNKYLVVFFVFSFYGLFLDEEDIFALFSQHMKLSKIQEDKREVEQKLNETKNTLKKLKHIPELEAYARENKLFKKNNEDIFIITYE
jgi:cell division protein DivIC